MQNEKYQELDALAAPNGYVVSPTKEDLLTSSTSARPASGIRSTSQKPIRTNTTS